LGISFNTVRQHISKIYEKLHVQNRTEALNRAFGGDQ
jgi:DNA-binding NarL/FixJ family response regulator